MPEQTKRELLGHTAQVAAAHLSRVEMAAEDIPAFIKKIYASFQELAGISGGGFAKQAPAVPIKKSIFPEYIVCLEDGKKLKMLKRHLKTAYKMTPEQYREKWGLPFDYPMVAPNYATKRSKLAKDIGLGKRNIRRRAA